MIHELRDKAGTVHLMGGLDDDRTICGKIVRESGKKEGLETVNCYDCKAQIKQARDYLKSKDWRSKDAVRSAADKSRFEYPENQVDKLLEVLYSE